MVAYTELSDYVDDVAYERLANTVYPRYTIWLNEDPAGLGEWLLAQAAQEREAGW